MAARPNRPTDTPSGVHRPEAPFSMLVHDFVERVMGDLTLAELKVYLSIYRETIGWRRQETTIAREKICSWSKIELRTFHDAVNSLVSRGLIRKQGNGGGKPASYAIVFTDDQIVRPTAPSEDTQCGPPHHDSAAHRTITTDPVLIEGFKENTKERDNPPTPLTDHLDLDRPIDKWAEQQARDRGLKLRITTGKQREALKAADSPDTRQQIIELFDREAAAGNSDVRDALLRFVGIDRQRKPTGTFQRSGGSAQSAGTKPPNKPAPALAEQVIFAQAEADIMGPVADLTKWPQWKLIDLEKMFIKDPRGFRQRLTETFTRFQPQGATPDAILAVFFDEESDREQSQRANRRRPSKTSGIDEYIQTLAARAT